jgi:hypothetical protein
MLLPPLSVIFLFSLSFRLSPESTALPLSRKATALPSQMATMLFWQKRKPMAGLKYIARPITRHKF